MGLFKRNPKVEAPRIPGRATVRTVGSSVNQSKQQSVGMKLRLLVALDDGTSYEVTTAWTVEQALVPQVQEGASFKVDVVDGNPAEVHPRDGRMSWDRIRTPADPKVRPVEP